MTKAVYMLCELILLGMLVACSDSMGAASVSGPASLAGAGVAQTSAAGESGPSSAAFGTEQGTQEEDESTIFLELEDLTVPVVLLPGLEITELEVAFLGRIGFTYNKDGLTGTANLMPQLGKHIDWLHEVDSLALYFEQGEDSVQLRVEWEAKGHNGTDLFLLDEAYNLWVPVREDVLLYPVDLSAEEAARLYPEEELTEYSFVALLSYETLYDLRVYWVWDFEVDPANGPRAVLLEEYDVYGPGLGYLWQSDAMYYKHLSIEYTDAAGQHYMQGYSIVDGKGAGSSHWVLEEADWNAD